jgi:hypothetical protein
MEIIKKSLVVILAAGLALPWVFSALPVDAQQRSGNTQRPITPSPPGSKGQQDQQEEERQSLRNAWLQGDEQQREQVVGCYRLSQTLAQHSRDILKMLAVSEVKWKDVATQYKDLQRGIQLLMERHEQFSMGLNNGQKSWWERQLTEIMTIELLLQERSDRIGRELDGDKPGSVQMAKAFSDLEGQFRKWNSFYGQIGADMNISNLDQRSEPVVIRGLPGAQNPRR